MTNFEFSRKALRGGSALQALALLGAGLTASAGLATPAFAQDYSNVSASGRVQSTDGQAITGATVTITSNGQGFSQTVTTDGSGAFRVSSLPQGSYSFTIAADGFETFTDNAVALTQGASANQFTLAPAGTASGGDVVVTAGRVAVADFDRTTTGAVINVADLATRVPVGRSLAAVILLSPGTTQGDSAYGNLASVGGSSISENTYYINGLNITNFRSSIGSVTVPFDFYQSVEVKNGGFGAEFGRATGGFINATTKSGSNEWHGGITFNYEPDALSSDAPNTYNSDNDSNFSETKDMIVQLSGPIIKDHLFFYGIYQSRDAQSAGGSTAAVTALSPAVNSLTGAPITQTAANANSFNNSCFLYPQYCVAFPSLPKASGGPLGTAAANSTNAYNTSLVLQGTQYSQSRGRSPFYGGKIDAVIVDGQRLEFTYFNTTSLTRTNYYGNSYFTLASGGRYNPNTNFSGFAIPPAAGGSVSVISGGENYVGRYTGTFTNWLTVSAAYGRNYNQLVQTSSGPNFPVISDQRGGAAISIGNPVGGKTIQHDKRDFYRADVDLYFNALGTHHIRFGYDREDMVGSASNTYNGDYSYLYTNTYVRRRFYRNSGGLFKTQGEAGYLQDSWSLFDNRLTLNLGVRDDRFKNENNLGNAFFKSGDNFAPRLAASFDPTGEGKTKIYGSFDRYFLPIATNTNTRLAGPELDYYQYYYTNSNVGAGIVGTTFNPDGSVNTLGTPYPVGACPALTVTPAPGGGNCAVNQNGQQPVYSALVASNLQAQSEDEYILGFEQRFGSRWKVGAYYTQRNLRQSLEDAYIDKGVVNYCRRNNIPLNNAGGTGCADLFTGATQYALINPGQSATVQLNQKVNGEAALRTVTLTAADLGLPQAKRSYKSMTFTLDREFDGVWSLSASYTLSALVGNVEGGVKSDSGQADSGLTTNFDFPALTYGSYGYLPQHRRHNIKLYGSYSPAKWLNIGANLQVTSQRKFACLGLVPNYVDGGEVGFGYGAGEGFYCNVVNGKVITTGVANNPTTATYPTAPVGTLALTPRGSQFQSDWLYNLGLDVAIKVPTDAFDGTLRVSVFNVLNRKAALDFNEIGTLAEPGAPNPTYGQTTSYQTPRYVRIQFGVNF
ncbi:hypothetical protein BH09PSE4_BH09PSE4_06870 [soil metagenome]